MPANTRSLIASVSLAVCACVVTIVQSLIPENPNIRNAHHYGLGRPDLTNARGSERHPGKRHQAWILGLGAGLLNEVMLDMWARWLADLEFTERLQGQENKQQPAADRLITRISRA